MIIKGNSNTSISASSKWTLTVIALLAVISFFLPWVKWQAIPVSGSSMASGEFFRISAEKFRLENPFPQFDVLMYGLWLIPVLALATIVIAINKKRMSFPPVLAGILLLSLVTVYVLFSNVLRDLGITYELQAGIYLAILSGIGLVVFGSRTWLGKIGFLIVGPLITYAAFSFATKQLEAETFENSNDLPSAFTIPANDLIREFRENDSLANARYREKILTVSGNITNLEFPDDSTGLIRFVDSTGSYAIFPFQKDAIPELKKFKDGDPVMIKASCSGGVYSEILETETITFKRCVLIKK